jgi:hypothetical protein
VYQVQEQEGCHGKSRKLRIGFTKDVSVETKRETCFKFLLGSCNAPWATGGTQLDPINPPITAPYRAEVHHRAVIGQLPVEQPTTRYQV